MLRVLVCALMLVLAPGVASADNGDSSIIAAARVYLDAYERLDVERLNVLYTDDASFNDPTSTLATDFGGPFIWTGRREILAGIARWKQSVLSLNYDIERVYEASGHVVFVGQVNPVVSTPHGPQHYRYNIVTIVTIAEGRVSEHRDYTDYAGYALIQE